MACKPLTINIVQIETAEVGSERSGYTAIGTVCNLAARLCAEAKDGQILVSSRVARAVETVATLEVLGNLELRGLRRPVAAFNIVQSTSAADARPIDPRREEAGGLILENPRSQSHPRSQFPS
jgi:class 3 adenylate cyclase